MGAILYYSFLLFLIHLLKQDGISAQDVKQMTPGQIIRNMSRMASTVTPPLGDSGAPLNVTLSLYVSRIHAINEESMDMTFDVYLRRKWKDSRLSFRNGPDSVVLSPQAVKQLLWVPDVFVVNSKNSVLHATTEQADTGARVKEDGSVVLSSRHSFTVHCDMDLQKFPFDQQMCALDFESYMYSLSDMLLIWEESGLSATESQPVAFTLKGYEATQKIQQISTGSYQRLSAQFHLQRLSAHYTATVFLPMFLVIALSSILFWLPLGALNEKAIFGGLLFLAMVVMGVTAQIGAPQVGYMKKLDLWVLFCLLWECLAILEILGFNLAKIHNNTGNQGETIELDQMQDENGRSDTTTLTSPKPKFHLQDWLTKVDYVLRFAFPVGFLVFALFFFLLN